MKYLFTKRRDVHELESMTKNKHNLIKLHLNMLLFVMDTEMKNKGFDS